MESPPYSDYNCSKIGMIMSNKANKNPVGVLHPSVKKWVELTFSRMYGHFCDSDKTVETLLRHCSQIGQP